MMSDRGCGSWEIRKLGDVREGLGAIGSFSFFNLRLCFERFPFFSLLFLCLSYFPLSLFFSSFLVSHCPAPSSSRIVYCPFIRLKDPSTITRLSSSRQDSRSRRIRLTSTVSLHGTEIGKGHAETQSLAIRRACEIAISKIKAGNLLNTLCICPRRKKGKETVLHACTVPTSDLLGAGRERS